MHKYSKKITAGLLAAAMIVPTTVSIAEPLSAFASELLGESTFDYKMIPWHTVENSPARQNFELSDGTVHIRILIPEGAEHEKWDLQLRQGKLQGKGETLWYGTVFLYRQSQRQRGILCA